MALTEQVILDIQSAERQITALESQLSQLGTPINVPVSVTGEQDLQQVRNNLAQSEDAVEALNRELFQTDDALDNIGREARTSSDAIERAGRGGATAFGQLRGALLGVGAAFLAIQGARVAFDFAGDAIQSASDLEQSIGAVDAVFGELGESVRGFGETADQSVGLAASQFNQLAALLGSQLQTFGFSAQGAADETQRLITLSADLAATFGGPVSDAVNAISSLLRGEVNPIERYGVAMNETLVAAKALELGLAATTAELTLQDKTLARLAILTEQTANAQGQFGRESETTAGRLERIRAQFENTRAEIGEALVPAFQALLDILPSLIDGLENGLVPAIASVSAAMAASDPQGFIDGLLRVPAAVSVIFGELGNILAPSTDAFADLESEVNDTANGLERVAEEAAQANRVGSTFTMAKAVQDLQASVQAGQAPIEAFFNVLADTADTLSADQLGALTRQLQTVAGLDFAGLGDLRRFLQAADDAQLEALGFDPDEVDAVVEALTELRREMLGVGDDAVETGRKGRGFAGDLDVVAASAALAAPKINDFGFQIERLSAQAAQEVDFVGLREAFQTLPDELDAAQAALRDEEGQIVDDFGTFLENLKDELEARQVFADNIETLRALGLDDLADVFTEAGLDAAGALAEAVADPAAAQAAENELDAFAARQAASYGEAFGAEVRAFVEQFPVIEMPVVPVLEPLQFPADLGNFSLPGGTSSRIGVTVTQTFTSPETPDTDRARAVQSINGVITANLQ